MIMIIPQPNVLINPFFILFPPRGTNFGVQEHSCIWLHVAKGAGQIRICCLLSIDIQ